MNTCSNNSLYVFFMMTFLLPLALFAQGDLPEGYQLLYSQDFEKSSKVKGFEMTDADAWKLSKETDNSYLELVGGSKYNPPVRSPENIAIIEGKRFGSFVLEVDLLQTGQEYGHRDLCLFFNMENPTNFYYIHIASIADPHAHNIFLVNDEARVAIATKTTTGIQWGDQQWHKIRIERQVNTGSIRLFYDDMNTPIMEANDQHFNSGYIGFGSFDDSGKFDNIKIWGLALIPEKKGFFR